MTCKFGISGAYRLACRGGKRTTCTARAQCTPAPFFMRRQVDLAKVHPCTEFGVASSKFTFTGEPHVKTASSPLARATCTPQEPNGTPQWILSRQSMHVTSEFGISGASRLTCRCVRIFKCANHLRVHCTCTMHPSMHPSSYGAK